ncbi:MAG: hypothetical protein IJF39_01880 [Clostridia bacterium]|nr:hypothetical protein [Clostridia bacterium]
MTEMQSLRLRSAKARRKAIFAGILYLIGTVGLAVAAFLPLTVGVVVGSYGELNITNFWQPIWDVCMNFAGVIAAPADYVLPLTASLLYTLMLLFTLINALRSISRLDHLCMKGSKRIGFNQNKLAVDAMGKIFACSFSLVVAHTLLIMAIFPAEGATFSLIGMIVGGVALLIHFVATPVAAFVSRFTVRETIAEFPRKHGMFSPILRNFFQVAAIGGIAFFLMNYQRDAAASILTGWANPIEGWNTVVGVFTGDNVVNGLFRLLSLGFWLVGLICFLAIFRHAVNPTEYYACGKKARGRKVVRFFSFNLFLTLFLVVLAPIVQAWIVGGAFPANIGELFLQNLSVIYAMAIALGLFIIECIMKNYPKVKKAYRPKAEEKDEKEEEKEDKEADKDEGDQDKEIQEPLIDDVPDEEEKKSSDDEKEEKPASSEEPKEKSAPAVEEQKEEPAAAPAAPLPPSPRAKQARAAKKKWMKKGLEARQKAKEKEEEKK